MSAAAAHPVIPSLKLNSGYSIPVVGFGTWRAAPNETKDSVYTALKAGYRHIDCAKIYANEKEVGQGIKRALDEKILTRDELFVTTKVWNSAHSHETALKSIRDSLSDLQLNYVDLVLIHWPVSFSTVEGVTFPKDADGKAKPADPKEASIKIAWQALEEAVDLKLTHSIGLSNHSIEEFQEVLSYARIKPAVNQIEVHPYFPQHDLFEYARKNGIIIVAYSPLGNLKREGAEDKTPLNDPIVKNLATKYNKTEGQIILRWGIQHGHVVLPKSVTHSRIESNIALFDFELSAEDMAELKKLGEKNIRFINPDFRAGGKKVFPE